MAEGNESTETNATDSSTMAHRQESDNASVSRASTTSSEIMRTAEVIMSEEANKHVRDKYRNLMQNFQEQTVAGDESITLDNLHATVRQANEAFSEVKRPREAAMDAQLLKTCGTLARINIEASQSNLRMFKPVEFARKLIGFAMPEDDDSEPNPQNLAHFIRLGQAVSGLYKTATGIEPMYSAIEYEKPPKPKPKPKEKVRDTVAAVSKPTEVVQKEGESGGGEAEVVSQMYKILKERYREAGNTPICFFSFVVNPNSYSHTIENLFNTSLLVREQLAVLSEDNNSIPVIAPTPKNQAMVGGTSKQCIISLSKNEWKDLVDTFEITRPMIPPPRKSNKRK